MFVALEEAELSHCSGVPRLDEPPRSRYGRVSAAGGGEVRGTGEGEDAEAEAEAGCGGGVFVFGGTLAWSEVDRRWWRRRLSRGIYLFNYLISVGGLFDVG